MLVKFGILLLLVTFTATQEFCGQKESDDSKTCISVRLPWQEDPIYFCTENDNVKYRTRCMDRISRYCPTPSSKTLQVATPWDCCALTSTPDHCADVSCPAAPFNRTCTETKSESGRIWDCCSNYFCEKGSPSTCQIKRLHPGCLSAPKDKVNCTAFKDDHGCCNKYQCAGEGKSGMCPMEAQAMNFRRMMENSTSSANKSMNHSFRSSRPHHLLGLIKTEMRCVGDYTCPGQMKCCSTSMSTYFDSETAKTLTITSRFGSSRKHKGIYGYCMEPVAAEEVRMITS